MKGKWHLCVRGIVIAATLKAGIASAYEVAPVTEGATVTGTAKFIGQPPPPLRFELRRYPDRGYCGALSDGSGYRLLREVAVSPEGGLKDVVITVEGVQNGKPFQLEETNLEANICQIVPFVSVMRDQRPLKVTNLDSVAHDLQVYERDREHVFIMFHRPALTKAGTGDVVRFTGSRHEVSLQCGMHPYMQGHGLAVDNPYYAITALDGSFTITDLPAGSYRVRAWHPLIGEQEQDLVVAPGGKSAVEFAFHAK